jgi:hypothetical protein
MGTCSAARARNRRDVFKRRMGLQHSAVSLFAGGSAIGLSATDAWHRAESVMAHVQHLSFESLVKMDHFQKEPLLDLRGTTGAQGGSKGASHHPKGSSNATAYVHLRRCHLPFLHAPRRTASAGMRELGRVVKPRRHYRCLEYTVKCT